MTGRVLVTGASGFVGRQALPALAALGLEVHAVSSIARAGGPATWHRADLLDPAEAGRLIDRVRPTHLLHLAWYAEHGRFWTSVENLRWVEASLGLLREFVALGGRRAVLVGTCAEYDWRFGFCSEAATPLVPSTLYGTCKDALRAMAIAFASRAGLSLAWARLFFLYGPGEHPGRLVPSVVRAARSGDPVRCTHGGQVRDFLHVRDAAEALVALLESRAEGPLNVASGRPVAIGEVVRKAAALAAAPRVPAFEFGAIAAADDDPPLLMADVRRLTGEVGWVPRYDLDDGLADAIGPAGIDPEAAR